MIRCGFCAGRVRPLSRKLGDNYLRITPEGADRRSLVCRFVTGIELLDGRREGAAGSRLSDPIGIRLVDSGGAPVAGREVQLTMREFDLLEFLMRSPGVVFSRETLLQRVWGWDFDGGSRTVDVHVQQIRAKLGDSSDLIETVRGVGYRVRG